MSAERRQHDTIRLFLAGDVMLGRGIDRILPHPGDPTLFEDYVRNAEGYVHLAQQRNGPIPRAAAIEYVWGDLLADLDARGCNARVVNLETAITTSDAAEPKGINYRMHPANAQALAAAGIDAVTLANNHTLDWGVAGLIETLEVLETFNISAVGAGRTDEEAAAPVPLMMENGGRILLLAYGARSSGVPSHWRAGSSRPGINLLPEDTEAAVSQISDRIAVAREDGDLVVVSLHWGGNWGYEIFPAERHLAHRLIKEAGVHIIYGHSSHHPKALEVHNGNLILYGAGDLINDYEGISGHEEYRSDLVLAYVLDVGRTSQRLDSVEFLPYRIKSFRLQRAAPDEVRWLHAMLERECRIGGACLVPTEAGTLRLSLKNAAGN